MSGEVLFSHGDLLEYTRPTKGLPDHDRPITVRGVVVGFSVRTDGHITIWLYEGAHQFGEWQESAGVREREGRIDKEQELVGWKLDELIEFDNFRVVRKGNSPRELLNFVPGGDRE